MIRILRHQHVREQARSGQAAINGAMGRGLLHDAITSRATEFRPHGANHFETGWNVFQHFGNILAQSTKRSTAIRTGVVFRLKRLCFTR